MVYQGLAKRNMDANLQMFPPFKSRLQMKKVILSFIYRIVI